MAIKRTFNGATIIKPGAYSKIVVENLTGFPLQPTGTVGIIGEAVGGEPRVLDVLSGTGIQDAKARYKSGPIADALELLANPTNDPRIANGASTIVVYKTNNSTQSELAVQDQGAAPADMLKFLSKNWGADENQISLISSEGEIEDQEATIIGTIAGPFDLTGGGQTLIMDIDGVTNTFTNPLTGAAETADDLIDALNDDANWSGVAPIVASKVTGTERIQLVYKTATPVLEYGRMSVDAVSTLDTIIGVSGVARGVKGSRIFTLVKGTLEEVSPELGGVPQLDILYTGAGTDAALDLKVVGGELRLQTTITGGGPGEALDILIRDADGGIKHTIKTLADLIDSNPVYSASVLGPNASLNADRLDFYDGIKIIEVAAPLAADLAAIRDHFNVFSQLASVELEENVYGSVEIIAVPEFFTGATDGTSANLDWANGFEAFKEERINIVVPLISKDVGPLTVDSINALAANHAIWGWSTLGKSERHVFVSKQGSKTALKDAAKAINSPYVSMVGQQPRVLNNLAELQWLDEWGYACLCAGQRAGAEVGEPLTYKLFNANDMRVLDGSWNPKKDFAEMIEAGVWIAEPLDTGGFRHVVGNTTYGVDANFVFNRESVVQAAGFVAYDLRFNLELVFTGTKARTGTAEAIANFIKNRMSTYLSADIIVGDDLNEGLGYKNLRVNVEGNTAIINISVTPVQGIDFLLPTIYLADIRQSA